MPRRVDPMLATAGELPSDPAKWSFELKWDGVRAISYVSGEGVRATGRGGTEISRRYPELEALGDMLSGPPAVFDGEIVSFDSEGRPSFERLQRRMHVPDPDLRLIRQVPAHYIVFDLLYLDGHELYDLPYTDRRALLDDLELSGGPIEVPPYLAGTHTDQIPELIEFTREQQLEGVIVKRLDSLYRPGKRVDTWLKVKNFISQDVVVCGWKPGKGRRDGGIGSLLMGVYSEGRLLFAGHVGTGFTDAALDDLAALITPLRRETSPYDSDVPPEYARLAQWVEPRVVGEVVHTGWTDDGRLRTPAWRGLRPDVSPQTVERSAE